LASGHDHARQLPRAALASPVVTAPPGTALEAFERWVADRTGLAFPGAHRERLLAALADDARHAGRPMDDHAAHLVAGGHLPDALVEGIVVKETWFWRESRGLALAAGALAMHPGSLPVRAWCAGCATGEEVWSLAIALDDAGLHGQFSVIGTDLSRAALDVARHGRYPEGVLRGADPTRLARHATFDHGEFEINPHLRKQALFFQHNLAAGAQPDRARGLAGLDLIVCRNVLLHFDEATRARVALGLFAALEPGGRLLTAVNDPPLGGLAPFDIDVVDGLRTYRRPPDETKPSSGLSADPPGPRGVPHTANTPEVLARAISGCRVLGDRGDLHDALACARNLARLWPLEPAVHVLLATLAHDDGAPDEALRALRRALYLDPVPPFLHFFAALLHAATGDTSQAEAALATTRDLCSPLPEDARLDYAEDLTPPRLAELATRRLAGLRVDHDDGPTR